MAVTGADKWYLAVLILGSDFKYYELQRDQEEIDALMAAEAELWEHVKGKTEPPVDGEDPTTEAVKAVYTDSVAESVSLFGREALLQEWAKLKEQIKDIEKRVDEIENTIKVDMGNAEEGACEGWKITWKPRSKNTFQAKDFAKAYPKIDLTPFWKTTVSRTFIVKEQKEEK